MMTRDPILQSAFRYAHNSKRTCVHVSVFNVLVWV